MELDTDGYKDEAFTFHQVSELNEPNSTIVGHSSVLTNNNFGFDLKKSNVFGVRHNSTLFPHASRTGSLWYANSTLSHLHKISYMDDSSSEAKNQTQNLLFKDYIEEFQTEK